MRLIDIKQCINIAFDNLDFKISDIGGGNCRMIGVQKFRIVLFQLSQAGFIQRKDFQFYDDVVNTVDSDKLTYSTNVLSYIADYMVKIVFLVEMLHCWINEYLPVVEDEKTINIKLPQIENLERLAEVSSLLEKSLSVIVYENGGDPIKVKQIDHGSFWVIISVCSVQIVKAIAKAANFAVELAQKIVELKKSIALLDRMNIENQAMDNLLKLQECAIDKLIQEKAMEMNSELPENPDSNERVKRLEKSIKELVDLITDGAEFHAALTASSEIVNEFPDFNKIDYLKNSVGVLSENKDTKDEVEQN